MTIRLGIVMDPIHHISYKKDSSLAMLWAAQDLGWELFYMEPQHLYAEQGVAIGLMSRLRVMREPNNFYEIGQQQALPLGNLDIILMRKDPPFDTQFLHTTYLLSQAEDAGALIINKPQSLRDCNEKLFATQFPECCPPLIVSSSAAKLKGFYNIHQDVIYKPLDGMGGASIFRIKPNDPNISVVIETLTNNGLHQIMAQKFVPEISNGDKRILVINGVPIDYALARVPASGETRGNLAAGGTGVAQPLSDRDRWIVDQVGPTLVEKGLLFVGLDVIGDYLTEINVTSPTCVREIDKAYGLDIAGELMACIVKQLEK